MMPHYIYKTRKTDILMKFFNILRTSIPVAVIAAAAMAMTSCDAIYDDEGDCSVRYGVKFRYDYNIQEADAFCNRVDAVSLYLFDPADGHLVWQGEASGPALGNEGWTMPVDVAPGRYDLIAWGHEYRDDASGFTFAGNGEVATKSDLICRMDRNTDAQGAYSDSDLHGLYHVAQDGVEFPDTYGDVTLPALHLTKDTNVVRILLQHTDGAPIEKNDFFITVTDDNGLLNYNNAVIPDETVTYRPWSVLSVETTMPDTDSRAVTNVSGILAELSMSRLMADHEPVLTVTHRERDGSMREVLSINLCEYVLMVKGNYHRHYTDQQYLDYQDEYNMTFFLTDENKWDTTEGIFINSWHVMLQFVDA